MNWQDRYKFRKPNPSQSSQTDPTDPTTGSESKRAILIGLNYTGTRVALRGCINDANRMKKILVSKYGYKNIKVLTDKNITTQNNILQVLDNLVSGNDKQLYFQYSGHGIQKRDINGDESDGMDEGLYSVGGTIILDDQIIEVVKKVKLGVQLIMIIDACHSGTIVDLPYQYNSSADHTEKVNDNVVEGDVICITGSRDNQVSMDVNQGNVSYGAMSNALQKVLKRLKNTITWKLLINQLRVELQKNRYAQVPQLCVSRPELIDSIVKL